MAIHSLYRVLFTPREKTVKVYLVKPFQNDPRMMHMSNLRSSDNVLLSYLSAYVVAQRHGRDHLINTKVAQKDVVNRPQTLQS